MVAKEVIKKCNDSSKWDAKWILGCLLTPKKIPCKYHNALCAKCNAGTGTHSMVGVG